jgi:xanthine dehydrogenase accessory factor
MNIWQHILTKLQDNQTVYLLTVIENSGSSPGRKGFKMMVAKDGFIFGSIGGGIMEFALVEECLQLLEEEKVSIFIKKQIHKGKIKDGSGMICSGKQTVVFHPLNKENIADIKSISTALKKNTQGILKLSPTSFSFADKTADSRFKYEINSLENWFFEEQINYKETLYIVGGGHVSLAVTETFVRLGFHVIVLDNRPNLNTFVNNSLASEKRIINYEFINTYIQKDNTTYIVIMTNTYTDDLLVLRKLIKINYNFVGVLGSKAKLKTMWTVLLNEGFTQQELDQIYAPVGLSIKSETPEEIAISIAAQLILFKNKQNI